MLSLSKYASTLHAISFKTSFKAHKIKLQQIRISNICIGQTIEFEAVKQAMNLENEWENSRCALFELVPA